MYKAFLSIYFASLFYFHEVFDFQFNRNISSNLPISWLTDLALYRNRKGTHILAPCFLPNLTSSHYIIQQNYHQHNQLQVVLQLCQISSVRTHTIVLQIPHLKIFINPSKLKFLFRQSKGFPSPNTIVFLSILRIASHAKSIENTVSKYATSNQHV